MHTILQYINRIKKVTHPDKGILDKIAQINIHRVFYLALISIPMRLFTIISFYNKPSTGDEQEILWRMGIIIAHLVYLIPLIILAVMSYYLRKKDQPSMATILTHYAMVVIMLIFGGGITAVDQLVTTSITPFLIACIAMGVIFIIKPIFSFLVFILSYIVFHFALGLVQTDLSVLLSNRVNGFTAIILGIFLSIILWRSNVINLQQKERIRQQKKELTEKNQELERLANFDYLTGLINRRHFEELMLNELLRIKRYGGESCLLILDLDNFKSINDAYGHPVGDKVLRGFATLFRTQLRETDIVARVGGEEFALLLIDTSAEKGKIVAQKIRKSAEKEIFVIQDLGINMTISIGMSLLDKRTNSYEEAYRHADRALYRAKARGKNRVEAG